MAGKNVDWNRRAGTLEVEIFKRAKVAYASIDYLVILYGGFFYLYITAADSSFYGRSDEYDFEKAGYNATGYKKIILKRDKEVIVSVTSKKILTKKQMEKRTRADPLAVGLGDQEIKEVAHDFYIEDRDDKLQSLCNTFEAEARKLVATDNSVYELGSNSSGGYGVCTKMNVKGKPIYKTKIGKTSKRTSLSISMCGRKSTITLTIPAEPEDTIIPQPASSQVSLPGMNEPLTLGSDTDVNSPTPNDNTETVATTEELVEIDITSVNGGRNYVTNAEAYAKYGYVERVVDFSEVESENQLLKLAKIYAKNMQYDEMVMDISALDLHTLNNNIDSLALASDVRCISIPHDLDIYLPVTEISIPLDDPSQVRYTLGASGVGSMSSSSTNSAKLSGKRLNDKFTKVNSEVLEVARAHMSSVINQKTTGYVNIIQGENGSEAIVISSGENWKTSKNLWKFDMNGLAYSEADNPSEATVANREWKVGMTMEGQIVADFINTGILSDGRNDENGNYWNLDTGVFNLVPVNNLSSKVDAIEYGPIGGSNLLNDTDAPSLAHVAASADRYFTYSGRASDYHEMKIQSISSANQTGSRPPTSAKYQVSVGIKDNKKDYKIGYCFYSGRCVNLSAYTTYTISCWARRSSGGYCSIQFVYGNTKYVYSAYTRLTGSWKNYSYTFKFDLDDVRKASSTASGARIYIYIKADTNSGTYAEISSVKLEYGTHPSSWTRSEDDISVASAKNLKDGNVFSKAAADALEDSLTKEKIFNVLTNNGRDQCIKMDGNGNLYINASYIKTGTLASSVIKTKAIVNTVETVGGHTFKNSWDLTTGGLLRTYKIEIQSGTIKGDIKTQNTYLQCLTAWDKSKKIWFPLKYMFGKNGINAYVDPPNMRANHNKSAAAAVKVNGWDHVNLMCIGAGGYYSNAKSEPTLFVGSKKLPLQLRIGRRFELVVEPKLKNVDDGHGVRFVTIPAKKYGFKVFCNAKVKKGVLYFKYRVVEVDTGFVTEVTKESKWTEPTSSGTQGNL